MIFSKQASFSKYYLFFFLFICTFIMTIRPVFVQAEETQTDPISVQLVSELSEVQPGEPFWVAVKINLQDSWHAYWKNPGPIGFPLAITWHLPEGTTAGEIKWPTPEEFKTPMGSSYGYSGEVWFLTQINPSKALKFMDHLEIQADADWLICSESSCVPGQKSLSLKLPISVNGSIADEAIRKKFEAAHASLPVKQEETKVQAKGENTVKLVVDTLPKDLDISSVYFAPESQEMVDEGTSLNWSLTSTHQLELTLKHQQSPSPHVLLEGVVVAQDQQGKQYATEISVQIENHGQKIAMADPIEKRPISNAGNLLKQVQDGDVAGSTFEGGLGLALVFAFLGGLFLNLMPCVLPVISFKIMSFVKMAGQDRKQTLKHGGLFALGVLVSFWILALALMTLQAYGHVVGWGFQLQEPLFVAILASVIFLFGLSMFGIFEFGAIFASWAGQQTVDNSSKSESAGSFFSGVLATTVATPCTGPFLGSAMGFAMTVSPIYTLMIFTSLGLGMAFPYLIFAAFPNLLRFLPKPGNWMVTFKELMGFVMLATTLWLVWVFGAQTDLSAVMVLMGAFLIMGLGCWIYGKWGAAWQERRMRLFATSIGFGLILVAFYGVYTSSTEESYAPSKSLVALNDETHDIRSWVPFSAERIVELQAQGTPVLIDFTARWCLICQANHMVLSRPEVSDKLAEMGVVKMLADWTSKDSGITRALQLFGRSGVPLYVLYGNDDAQTPQVLPQVLTPDIVMEYLNNIEQQVKG